jgi:hypothetical protein
VRNEWFEKGALERMLGQHLSGEKNRRLLIWAFLSIEFWIRGWLKPLDG